MHAHGRFHPQSVDTGLISGRRDAGTCNSLGMGAHARVAHLLLSGALEGTEQHRSEFSSSGVAVPAWGRGTVARRASHDHSGGDSRDTSLRGLCVLLPRLLPAPGNKLPSSF